MALSAAPTFTPGNTGNVLGSTTLTVSGGATPSATATFSVGVANQTGSPGSTSTASALGGRVQVLNKGASAVSTTNGLQVTVYSTSDGINYDTIAYGGTGFVIPTTANTASFQSFDLPPGQFQINVKNLDATNTITVEVTLGTLG